MGLVGKETKPYPGRRWVIASLVCAGLALAVTSAPSSCTRLTPRALVPGVLPGSDGHTVAARQRIHVFMHGRSSGWGRAGCQPNKKGAEMKSAPLRVRRRKCLLVAATQPASPGVPGTRARGVKRVQEDGGLPGRVAQRPPRHAGQ